MSTNDRSPPGRMTAAQSIKESCEEIRGFDISAQEKVRHEMIGFIKWELENKSLDDDAELYLTRSLDRWIKYGVYQEPDPAARCLSDAEVAKIPAICPPKYMADDKPKQDFILELTEGIARRRNAPPKPVVDTSEPLYDDTTDGARLAPGTLMTATQLLQHMTFHEVSEADMAKAKAMIEAHPGGKYAYNFPPMDREQTIRFMRRISSDQKQVDELEKMLGPGMGFRLPSHRPGPNGRPYN